MYKILINAGTENYYFIDKIFETAEEALEYAMDTAHGPFLIVKIAVFYEAK